MTDEPLLIASSIKSCLSAVTPLVQTKISPGSTTLEILFIPYISISESQS